MDFFRTMRECGLEVKNLDRVGTVRLDFTWQPQMTELHIFRTFTYSGAPVETKGKKDML